MRLRGLRDIGSVWRGIRVMRRPSPVPKPGWTIKFGFTRFWAEWWTPRWHEGRGPYISIGLGLIAIYRGY